MTKSKLELQSKVQFNNVIERVLQFRLQLRQFRALDENQIFSSFPGFSPNRLYLSERERESPWLGLVQNLEITNKGL